MGKMKVISQSRLREGTATTHPKAKGNIFRKAIQWFLGGGTEAVDLAESGIALDQDALCDLYESAHRLLPGCKELTMPLEAIAEILSPETTRFEARILLQKLNHSRLAVLSMTPDTPLADGTVLQNQGTPERLTVWFCPCLDYTKSDLLAEGAK